MRVPEDMARLAGTGLAVIVGTRDAANRPELSRGWGLRVTADRCGIEVCVPRASGAGVLKNIAATASVAVTLVQPTTYRSFQVKGEGIVIGDATADDLAHIEQHQRAFLEEVAAVGMAGPEAAHLFDREREPGMATIRVRVESLFDQTPGPGAGARL